MEVPAEYKCVKRFCGHEWSSPMANSPSCPKCGSLYVYWTNYYSWKWLYFDFSYNIKEEKYYSGDKEVMDPCLPIRYKEG